MILHWKLRFGTNVLSVIWRHWGDIMLKYALFSHVLLTKSLLAWFISYASLKLWSANGNDWVCIKCWFKQTMLWLCGMCEPNNALSQSAYIVLFAWHNQICKEYQSTRFERNWEIPGVCIADFDLLHRKNYQLLPGMLFDTYCRSRTMLADQKPKTEMCANSLRFFKKNAKGILNCSLCLLN